MRGARVVLVFAFLALVAPLLTVQAAGNDWDYLLLEIRWSGAVCVGVHGNCYVPSDVTDFILHGLWPNRNDNSYPSFCDNNNPFDASQIQDLMPQLEEFWTDVLDATGDTSFWEHEWDKHGTCAESLSSLSTQHAYFEAALQLRKQADTLGRLEDAGIRPSNTTTYSLDDLNKAVSGNGKPGYFYCMHDSELDATIVSNVAYCVDKNLQFTQCPPAFEKQYPSQANCGGNVLLPLAGH